MLCVKFCSAENFVSRKGAKAAKTTGKELMRPGSMWSQYEIRNANDKIVRDKVNWELIPEVRAWLYFDRERSALFRRA